MVQKKNVYSNVKASSTSSNAVNAALLEYVTVMGNLLQIEALLKDAGLIGASLRASAMFDTISKEVDALDYYRSRLSEIPRE